MINKKFIHQLIKDLMEWGIHPILDTGFKGGKEKKGHIDFLQIPNMVEDREVVPMHSYVPSLNSKISHNIINNQQIRLR